MFALTEWMEWIVQVLFTGLVVAYIAFGGEEFRSDYEPPKKWIVGNNLIKNTLWPRKHSDSHANRGGH